MSLTPHETLGIEPSATAEEVAEAYRALVHIFHPDRYADMPERVRLEAERKMKDVTEAYAALKGGGPAAPYRPVQERRQWPKPPAPAEPAPAGAAGVVATPLPAPLTDYAVGQWNAASRHWTWSDANHCWVCRHGRDMCGSCGSTPDVVASRAGVVREPYQWRRSLKGDVWICVSHHKLACDGCGTPPAESTVIDIRSRSAAAAAKGGPRRRRVAWR